MTRETKTNFYALKSARWQVWPCERDDLPAPFDHAINYADKSNGVNDIRGGLRCSTAMTRKPPPESRAQFASFKDFSLSEGWDEGWP